MGVVGGFLSAVDEIVASIAGDRRLGVIWFAAGTACSRQAIMRQYAGVRVAVAVPGDPDGTFTATRRFAKVSHHHPPTSGCASGNPGEVVYCPPPAAR